MKKIKRETESLVEKSLLTFAEKCAPARTLRTHVARRRHPPAVKKRFSGRADIQKSLLPEHLGPNGLVTLIAIAIERVVPPRARVDVFAALRIAPIVRLRKRPPVRNGVINMGNGGKKLRRELLKVRGIGMEAVPQFAICARRCRRIGRRRGP